MTIKQKNHLDVQLWLGEWSKAKSATIEKINDKNSTNISVDSKTKIYVRNVSHLIRLRFRAKSE